MVTVEVVEKRSLHCALRAPVGMTVAAVALCASVGTTVLSDE